MSASSVNCGLPEGKDWVPPGVESSGYIHTAGAPPMLGEQTFNHLFPPPSLAEGVAVQIMYSRWRNNTEGLARLGPERNLGQRWSEG